MSKDLLAFALKNMTDESRREKMVTHLEKLSSYAIR